VRLSAEAAPQWESGSTAVAVLIRGDHLVGAWAGDSRAVLSRGGQAVALTRDHSCEDRGEVERVKRAGGFVGECGVGNLIAVSRALGDFDPDCGRKILGLTAEPGTFVETLADDDEFVLLACDGVWDVFESQQAVAYVRGSLKRHSDVDRACRELANEALRKHSSDNVTVLIVSFHQVP
jgi:protein phosphatase 2C family protein 2/3